MKDEELDEVRMTWEHKGLYHAVIITTQTTKAAKQYRLDIVTLWVGIGSHLIEF